MEDFENLVDNINGVLKITEDHFQLVSRSPTPPSADTSSMKMIEEDSSLKNDGGTLDDKKLDTIDTESNTIPNDIESETQDPCNVTDLIKFIEDEMSGQGLENHDNGLKISKVSEKLSELMCLLLEKSWQDSPNDDSLKVFLEHDVLNKVYSWISSKKLIMRSMMRDLLGLYNNILSIGSDSFIRNAEFTEPLLLLLLALRPNEKKRMPHEIEMSYVQLLSSLSGRLIDDQFLAQFHNLRVSKQGYQLPKYAFINLLMFFVHEEGQIGNYARDSLIVCAQISANNDDFGKFIAKESDCCNILAAGLIGLYSSLPTTLEITTDDWYCITKNMISNHKEIRGFVRALRFCCEVIKFGHLAVQERLLSLIHDGFLSSVLAAALHQQSTEAIVAAVAYLELFLREVTDIRFMRVILKFLFTDDYDGRLIIDTLMDLIPSNSTQLCMVTLQFFKTLMDLNCEDIIFHLIIRYLIPCKHLLPNQKRTIKELDFYCKSATMFLYLTPSCCLETVADAENNGEGDREQRSVDRGGNGQLDKQSELELRNAFTKCLDDARGTVRECKQACQSWSAVYDGMDVMTEVPQRSASSVLISQSQSDRRNSEVFSFAHRRSSTDKEPDRRNEMKQARSGSYPLKTLRVANGCSETIQENEGVYTDSLGPFITILYEKLEKMPENSFYINLQLTALISRIACYPQPLLRSLLLNSNLIMQPGVKSLFQIVTRIAHSTDMFVSQLDDYQALINRARSNLQRREKKLCGLLKDVARKDSNASNLSVNIDSKDNTSSAETAPEQSVKNVNTSHGLGDETKYPVVRKDSLYSGTGLEMSFCNAAGTAGRLHPAIKSPTKRTVEPTRRGEGLGLKKKNPTAVKNAIYCALVLEEWLKELAAISLEHNLV